MGKLNATPASVRRLEDVPNVGKAVADILRRIGIDAPAGLVGRDPFALYADVNAVCGIRSDPCLLDTFIAATRFMGGEPARPWWAYTAERKARLGASQD
ncbi:helix-hairpin-helix domain-containing protein [Zoogloea sp.]|uniref:helix-hairpin-helix domain-containing protein n=1 Tax=Zoogloea sp. TaxID=49181 RepID=UPI0035B2AD69